MNAIPLCEFVYESSVGIEEVQNVGQSALGQRFIVNLNITGLRHKYLMKLKCH